MSDLAEIRAKVVAGQAEVVRLAMAFADLVRELDELINPPGPGLKQEPHVE